MKTCYALLYPNTYPETFCNVIMEARASKTPFVTSDKGALKETGGWAGLYIKGNPYTEEYQLRFLDRVYSLIDNKELYNDLVSHCDSIRTWKDYSEDINRLIGVKD